MAKGLEVYSGPLEIIECAIPASDGTAVAKGDAVKLAGSSDADGRPTVAQAAAGEDIFGVVMGVQPDTEASLKYRAASTARKVTVNVCKDTVYKIEEDADSDTVALTDVGDFGDLVVAAVDTTLGISQMQLDSSSVSATVAGLRVLGPVPDTDNLDAIGTQAEWLVKIREHELTTTKAA